MTTRPFLIRNPETRVQFELSNVQFFVDTYQGEGFVIVDPAPTGYCVPELPVSVPVEAPKQPESKELTKMTRAELDLYAEEIGVESPTKFANKEELIAAIELKRSE